MKLPIYIFYSEGLDPAAPYYFDTHIDVRLDQSDAEFVDVIHTNAPFVGTITRSGHLDFWPNGGLLQRGCEPSKGMHKISAFLFRISVSNLSICKC